MSLYGQVLNRVLSRPPEAAGSEEEATSPGPDLTQEERDARTVLCMQLSAHVSKKALKQLFTQVGKVRVSCCSYALCVCADVRILNHLIVRGSKDFVATSTAVTPVVSFNGFVLQWGKR